MKFICEQEKLRNAIDIAINGVNKRSSIPAQKGFKITADLEDGLTIQSVNINMGISTKLQCDIEEEGEIIVMADIFSNMIRKLSRGLIRINTDDKGILHIENDISEFDIQYISTENFNYIDPIVNKECELVFDKDEFTDLISSTLFSASNEENKGSLQGCLFNANEGSIEVVALDGFRMAFAKKEIEENNQVEVIIIGTTLRKILNIIRKSNDEGNIRFVVGDRLVMVYTPEATITARTLEGGFADYHRFFPKEIDSRMILNKEKLEEAIERAIIVGGDDRNKIVSLQKQGSLLTIHCSSNEGRAKEELFIEDQEGDDIETSMNSRFLLDVLKAHDQEDVVFNFSSLENNLSSCLITFLEPDEEAYKYLILPVRGHN